MIADFDQVELSNINRQLYTLAHIGQDKATAERLRSSIKQLGEPDTQIFIRRYYMGEPVKNIAKSMDMKTDTVSKRLSRGLLKLRKILEEGS